MDHNLWLLIYIKNNLRAKKAEKAEKRAQKRAEKNKKYCAEYYKKNKTRLNAKRTQKRRDSRDDVVILTEVLEELENNAVTERDAIEKKFFYKSQPLFKPEIFEPDLVYLARRAEILKKGGTKNFIIEAIRGYYEERAKEDSVLGRKFQDAFDCHEFLETWGACGIPKWKVHFYMAKNTKTENHQRQGGRIKINADGREKEWAEDHPKRQEFQAKIEVVRALIDDLRQQNEAHQIPFVISQRKLSMKLGDGYSTTVIGRCLAEIYGKKKWRRLGVAPMMNEDTARKRLEMSERMLKEYPKLLGADWMDNLWTSDESMVGRVSKS